MNESDDHVEVINNLPQPLTNVQARLSTYNLGGSMPFQHDWNLTAPPSRATDLGSVEWPAGLSFVYFIKLELHDANGALLSDNFYWHALSGRPEGLQDLGALPTVTLDAKIRRHDADAKCLLDVTLRNPAPQIALMAHLQLRRQQSGRARAASLLHR